MVDKTEVIGAYWSKDYEKFLLSRKYYIASHSIGYATAYPTMQFIKEAYGYIIDFISQIPLPENKTREIETRKKLLAQLDEIGLVLYGELKNPKIKELLKKYNLFTSWERSGVKKYEVIQNLPLINEKLRNILIKAGEFATSLGLRIIIPSDESRGVDKILEEEGFEDLNIEGITDEELTI